MDADPFIMRAHGYNAARVRHMLELLSSGAARQMIYDATHALLSFQSACFILIQQLLRSAALAADMAAVAPTFPAQRTKIMTLREPFLYYKRLTAFSSALCIYRYGDAAAFQSFLADLPVTPCAFVFLFLSR